MLWIVRSLLLFASYLGFVTAKDRCKTEVSIPGMALKGFVFKKMSVSAPHVCDINCEREITCQSYNYVIGEKSCELNHRTKEARPENFHSDEARFYMVRVSGRSMYQSNPFFFIYFLVGSLSKPFIFPEQERSVAKVTLLINRSSSLEKIRSAM